MDASTIACLEEIPDTSEPSVDDGLGVYELTEETDDAPEKTFEFRKVLQRFDEQTQAAAEKTEDLNLGTEEEQIKVLISGTLSPTEKEQILAILREYVDVFAWNYEDMPGLD